MKTTILMIDNTMSAATNGLTQTFGHVYPVKEMETGACSDSGDYQLDKAIDTGQIESDVSASPESASKKKSCRD
jgi:hypothetical protein